VGIVRAHVLAGRAFSSIEEMNAAFAAWVPLRRAKVHGTHGEVIGHRAVRDHMALRPLPETPYVVAQRHLRHVGKDCLVAFDANLYWVPAAGSAPANWSRSVPRVPSHAALHGPRLGRRDSPGRPSANCGPRRPHCRRQALGRSAHRRRPPRHHRRQPAFAPGGEPSPGPEAGPLQALLNRAAAARVEVGRRPLSVYDELTGTRPFTSNAPTKEAR